MEIKYTKEGGRFIKETIFYKPKKIGLYECDKIISFISEKEYYESEPGKAELIKRRFEQDEQQTNNENKFEIL